MRKIITGLAGLALLLFTASAFASDSVTQADKTAQMSAQQKQFFQETKAMRKQRHQIKCELMGASQAANPDQQKIDGLKKELIAIKGEIQAKAKELGVTRGAGNCENPGIDGSCGQNRPLNCPGLTQGSTVR